MAERATAFTAENIKKVLNSAAKGLALPAIAQVNKFNVHSIRQWLYTGRADLKAGNNTAYAMFATEMAKVYQPSTSRSSEVVRMMEMERFLKMQDDDEDEEDEDDEMTAAIESGRRAVAAMNEMERQSSTDSVDNLLPSDMPKVLTNRNR